MRIPKLKDIGKEKLLLLGAAGIILIIVSYFDIGSDKKNEKDKQIETTLQTNYADKMEEKVKELVESIDGVKDVNVVITLKEGNEKVVKEDVESSNNKREEESVHNTDSSVKKTTVVLSNDGDEIPYIIKEIYPRVQGVAITAKGVKDVQTKNSIISMVEALFDVPIHKITVIEI